MEQSGKIALFLFLGCLLWGTTPASVCAQTDPWRLEGGILPTVDHQFSFGPSISNVTHSATLEVSPASAPGLQNATPAMGNAALPMVDDDLQFEERAPTAAISAYEPGKVLLRQPWWNLQRPPKPNIVMPAQYWELDQLIWLAVKHSPLVQAVLIEPQIQQARAAVTIGEFDATTFLDSIFNDTSDPVGNTLVTGTAPRLNDHLWENRSGVRKKNLRGGQAELFQEFFFKDSNSDFFVPGNQADTKMVLRYRQPLLRGAGEAYNRSSYVVATLTANRSFQEASKRIQEHVFSISNSYWELYAARAFHEQIRHGLERLQHLRNQLAGRADIDGLRSQLLRADAAIARQRSAKAQALAQIRTAEANLRSAVAAPQLRINQGLPMLPATPPADWRSALSRENELQTALHYHPDIQALRIRLKSDRIRLQVAENELRPTLDLVLEGYVRGLNGGFNAVKSFGDQFSEGAPSYSAGLSYSRPYRNTAAKAILRERRMELRRTLLEFDNTLLTLGANVESAVAQVEAAFTELESTVQSTLATHAEIEYLTARWQNAFLDATQNSLLLDQLLSAHLQLIQVENAWARAQADHMLAIARLRLETGTLLPINHIGTSHATP